MKNLVFLFSFFFVVLTTYAQQLDPIHYPPESEWEYLQTKQTDSLIQVMKFYFNANDTLFFREAVSQQVVKLALADIQRPSFYLGTKYFFAERFYGPNGANAKRTSKNEKLDRFYYYYLNAPALPIGKIAPVKEITTTSASSALAITETIPAPENSVPIVATTPPQTEESGASAFYSVIKPHILLKNGQVLRPDNVYFLSEGQIYFGQGVRQHIYKVDTAEIATMVGFEIGKNLRLNNRVGYVFGGRCMRGIGFFVFIINGVISANSEGYGFFATIPVGLLNTYLFVEGTKRIQNKRRHKHAQYVQFAK
ncbi:MAG: hypothetical protein ACKOWX_06525 [Flavobacteriales bacterium]